MKTFKAYAPSFVHVDVKYLPRMPDEDQRTYLFAAINRATHWVYNGRIADVLRTLRFDSATSLQTTLKRFVYLYNYHIPQKDLLHKTPLQMLQKWYAQKPHLFKKIPRNHTGPDN